MRSEDTIKSVYEWLKNKYLNGDYAENEFIQGELNAFDVILEISNENSCLIKKEVVKENEQ